MFRQKKQNGGGSEPSHFLNLTPCEWNPIFATRRQDVNYAIENEPFIEGREVEDSIVRCFMKSYDESDACLPRADSVEEFCFGASLGALQAKKGEASERFVAWLDERSSAAGKEEARAYRGPLSAQRLCQELKRPVRMAEFELPPLSSNLPPPHSPTSRSLQVKGQRIKANVELYTSVSALVDLLVGVATFRS